MSAERRSRVVLSRKKRTDTHVDIFLLYLKPARLHGVRSLASTTVFNHIRWVRACVCARPGRLSFRRRSDWRGSKPKKVSLPLTDRFQATTRPILHNHIETTRGRSRHLGFAHERGRRRIFSSFDRALSHVITVVALPRPRATSSRPSPGAGPY